MDRQNRQVKYLRLSVTDRCNLRCTYCMPEEMTFSPRAELLTFEEMTTLVGIFVELGITHLRLTGGEPLARRDFVRLVGMLAAVPGVQDMSMTTNGVLLHRATARALARAGLKRVNISLDTLDPARFEQLTRRGNLQSVLDGIRAAREAFEGPVKINAVLVRGANDREAGDLIRWAGREGLVLRFIEYMPIGIDAWWKDERFLRIDAMRAEVESQGFSIAPLPDADRPVGGGPARYWSVVPPEGGDAITVGFIAALTHNFCGGCNRVRLTSDGRVRECLTSGGTLSLRDMLRGGMTREVIRAAVHQALYGKVDGHGFDAQSGTGGRHALVAMSALGG